LRAPGPRRTGLKSLDSSAMADWLCKEYWKGIRVSFWSVLFVVLACVPAFYNYQNTLDHNLTRWGCGLWLLKISLWTFDNDYFRLFPA
jgi:hypothetical protein